MFVCAGQTINIRRNIPFPRGSYPPTSRVYRLLNARLSQQSTTGNVCWGSQHQKKQMSDKSVRMALPFSASSGDLQILVNRDCLMLDGVNNRCMGTFVGACTTRQHEKKHDHCNEARKPQYNQTIPNWLVSHKCFMSAECTAKPGIYAQAFVCVGGTPTQSTPS